MKKIFSLTSICSRIKHNYKFEKHEWTFPKECIFLFAILFLFLSLSCNAESTDSLLIKGWNALVIDNDVEALKYFSSAYTTAIDKNDTEKIAESLLDMGICTYSVSYSEGLDYAMRAMATYKKLERAAPAKALQGRSRCLQLISTINGRQGKYRECIALSKEAIQGLPERNDSSGTLGLIYSSLGDAYKLLNVGDSSEYFHHLALTERLSTRNFIYLPGSYISVADIELHHHNKSQSRIYYDRALVLADSTGNRQAQVSCLLGFGKWYLAFDKDEQAAENCFIKAQILASALSDKLFYRKTLEQLIALKKQQGDFPKALAYREELQLLNDSLYSWERQRMVKSLEVQFDVAEKDRKLSLVQKEKDITTLTNYLLWGTIAFLLIISVGIILFLKRINKRDKLLLQTKEELVKAIEEQKHLKEQQMQNELEFKESQLSAMTFQMLQKNELMQELKDKLEQDKTISTDNSINKIINKGLNHDKEWDDFNVSFESINKNFYSRLKSSYPDISPNDLKICALIKLNLSIKEMAGILNISPDSVKTARYRLRKKLQLNTEDNLTDFILNL